MQKNNGTYHERVLRPAFGRPSGGCNSSSKQSEYCRCEFTAIAVDFWWQEKTEVDEDTETRSVKFDGVWGARGGKRKRSSQKSEDYYHSPAVEREQVADFVDDDQWTILALKGKSPAVLPNEKLEFTARSAISCLISEAVHLDVAGGKRDFTPRLGRESGEDMVNAAAAAPSTYSGERWYQDNNDIPNDLMAQRSPPFAPRLGRHLYIPRLGRKLEKLIV